MGIDHEPPLTAARRYASAAAISCAASVALFWPGYAMYDSVAQYEQVVSGTYDDWHPPVMARLWSVLHPLGPGAAPMLVLQMALYWLGLGGIAAGLAAAGRQRAAAAMLAIGMLPPFLGWQAVVLKDAQATGALLAAVGLVAWWRLRGMRMPGVAVAAVVVLIAYATLARANAVFAAVPLAMLLIPVRPAVRIAVGIGITLLVLALSPVLNHRVMGAKASGVDHTAPFYDLAGIAARVDDARGTGLTPAERRMIVARRCAQPFFWDPLGDPVRCAGAMDRLRAVPIGAVNRLWIAAIVEHPIAYAGHRIAHLNSTDRWLVPAHWANATPPQVTERNDLGLATPGRLAVAWQRLAGVLVETPIAWPFVWIVVAGAALAVAVGQARSAARDLAVALLGSALLLEASFGVLSIASDLRYHLWSMIAAAVGVVLLADGTAVSRRVVGVGGAVLVVVVAAGVVARVLLPAAPATYLGMLG